MSVKRTLVTLAVGACALTILGIAPGLTESAIPCGDIVFEDPGNYTCCENRLDMGWGEVRNENEEEEGWICVAISVSESENIDLAYCNFEFQETSPNGDCAPFTPEESEPYNLFSKRLDWGETSKVHLMVWIPSCSNVDQEHEFTTLCE